jgi:hypothetical protein
MTCEVSGNTGRFQGVPEGEVAIRAQTYAVAPRLPGGRAVAATQHLFEIDAGLLENPDDEGRNRKEVFLHPGVSRWSHAVPV